MRRWWSSFVLAISCGAFNTRAQTFPVADDFESGLAGWTFSNEDGAWNAGGGNPGGYVLFEELHPNQTLALAPERYLGNWSPLDGAGEICFDFRIFKTGDYEGGGDLFVRLTGPGGAARYDVASFDGVTPWQPYVVPVAEDRWTVLSGTWDALVADVTEFGITVDIFDSTSLGETNGLDNVVVRQNCRADFDGDGFVNGVDFDGYVAAFEASTGAADMDGDTFVTGADFDLFVQLFEAGC